MWRWVNSCLVGVVDSYEPSEGGVYMAPVLKLSVNDTFFSFRMNVSELVVDPETSYPHCKEKGEISVAIKRQKLHLLKT